MSIPNQKIENTKEQESLLQLKTISTCLGRDPPSHKNVVILEFFLGVRHGALILNKVGVIHFLILQVIQPKL